MSRLSAVPQPVRFVVSGGLTAVTYLGGTLLLSTAVGLPIQAAILIAYAVSLGLHFTLQRYVVFRDHDEFELALHQQLGRYLGVASLQYAFTAAATAVLPTALGVTPQVVYVCAAISAAVFTFVVLRAHVFHAPTPSETADGGRPRSHDD